MAWRPAETSVMPSVCVSRLPSMDNCTPSPRLFLHSVLQLLIKVASGRLAFPVVAGSVKSRNILSSHLILFARRWLF